MFFPAKSLLHLSVHSSDFVAGVPKTLMLYGSVSTPNHHSHFGFHLSAFRMGGLGFRLGPDAGKLKERKQPWRYCHSGNYLHSKFLTRICAYIRPYKKMFTICACCVAGVHSERYRSNAHD